MIHDVQARADRLAVPSRAKPRVVASRETEGEPLPSFEEAAGDLLRLVGLRRPKELFREIYALARVDRERRRFGLKVERQSLHMVFFGNPGTGKTTVARLFGEGLRRVGLLSRGHFTEVGRVDLVGEYVGHTAQKTHRALRQAQGGVLFIDEAYALGRGGERDFGREAIDTLVKEIEDGKGDLVVILAGYGDEMARFFEINPGLASRIPLRLAFPDYGADELLKIAQTILEERDYRLTPDGRYFLQRSLEDHANRLAVANGNGRLIRNLMERAIRQQALRLMDKDPLTPQELRGIGWSDIQGSGLL